MITTKAIAYHSMKGLDLSHVFSSTTTIKAYRLEGASRVRSIKIKEKRKKNERREDGVEPSTKKKF